MYPYITLLLFISSYCSWAGLNFPILLWGPAAPQVVAVCVLHTNNPVSPKDTVYSSTQRPATVRIQRPLPAQCKQRKEHETVPYVHLDCKRGTGVVVESFWGPAGEQRISNGAKLCFQPPLVIILAWPGLCMCICIPICIYSQVCFVKFFKNVFLFLK